jgi:anthranilate phosphoribosyltransferase
MAFLAHLHAAIARESLAEAVAERAMTAILEGDVSTPQITAFLVALKMKGETAEEIVGFARAMRRHSIPIPLENLGAPLVDTAGTGGSTSPP